MAHLDRFYYLLSIFFQLGFLVLTSEAYAQSSVESVEIESIIISKNCSQVRFPELHDQAQQNPDCPKYGDIQLIQITLQNNLSKVVPAVVQVMVHREGDLLTTLKKEQQLLPRSQVRSLFQYQIPQEGGEYQISAKLLDLETPENVIALSKFATNQRFYLLKQSELDRVKATEELRIAEGQRIPQQLKFDPPDLKWEQIHVFPKHVLRGEKLRLRVDLTNVGGDLARNVKSRVSFYNVRLPRRKTIIAEPAVDLLAPGETATFELEYTFPGDQILGEYKIEAVSDVRNLIPEIDEENNALSSELMQLSDIKLLLPPDKFSFEEEGLFLFQWDSITFREFKLQIGINKKFDDPNNYFELPQGGRWVSDKELSPLKGELPEMGIGLTKRFRTRTLYWRIVGRQSSGQQTHSTPREFTIGQQED